MRHYLEKNHNKQGLKELLKWKSNCIAGPGPQFEPHATPKIKQNKKSTKPLLMIKNTLVISMH
jgi:hypothetical protein